MIASPRTLQAVMVDLPPLQLALGIAIPVVLIFFWVRRLRLTSMWKVPGPWYLKLTTAFIKYHEFSGSKTLWVHNLHLNYGPVVQLGRNEVSFASFTASKQIYNTGNREFIKTELYNLFLQDGHVNLFTAIDSGKHAEIRRQLADRYSNSTVLKSQIVQKIAERAEAFTSICAGRNSADIYLYLHAYALDCVTAMLFHPYATDSLQGDRDKEMVRLLSYSSYRSGLLIEHYAPIIAKIWKVLLPQSKGLQKGGAMIKDYVETTLAAGGHSDFTLAAKFSKIDGFDRDLAIAECLDHIGAGIETTGDTLCWLMWELSQPRSQAVVQRLHAELIARRPDVGLEALPYLGAVVQESLRLWAPGTLPLPRYVPKDGRHLDGYFLPARTIVGSSSYSMSRLDTSVFPQPEEFLPERWLESEGNSDRQRLFFAFSVGARTCIGKNLAIAEMRACLDAVYSRFRTEPAHDMNASMEPDDLVLSSRPKDMSCRVRFVPWDN